MFIKYSLAEAICEREQLQANTLTITEKKDKIKKD